MFVRDASLLFFLEKNNSRNDENPRNPLRNNTVSIFSKALWAWRIEFWTLVIELQPMTQISEAAHKEYGQHMPPPSIRCTWRQRNASWLPILQKNTRHFRWHQQCVRRHKKTIKTTRNGGPITTKGKSGVENIRADFSIRFLWQWVQFDSNFSQQHPFLMRAFTIFIYHEPRRDAHSKWLGQYWLAPVDTWGATGYRPLETLIPPQTRPRARARH